MKWRNFKFSLSLKLTIQYQIENGSVGHLFECTCLLLFWSIWKRSEGVYIMSCEFMTTYQRTEKPIHVVRLCVRGFQWCCIFHYHWWTASIIYIKEMFKQKNVVNNVDMSSWMSPWQNGPYKNQHTERRKTVEHKDATDI